ncbi:MAG: glycosyltransferase family 2 protein [Xanthomonadales bacterium]|nr:glycosyltransferase family 2 protein [Xanthomonadales bacterium]
MKSQTDVKEHREQIKYFSLPMPIMQPRKNKLQTDLKIGLIASDRLYDGFRFEAEVTLLSEENWLDVLKYIKIDFLLVESCLHSAINDWAYAQVEGSDKNKHIKKVIQFAKDNSIPTVYWFTHDHAYHQNFKEFSSIFDYVFCSDNKELLLLRKEGVEARLLLPAMQPALHNPFRENKHYYDFNVEILFDGWSDIFRHGDKLTILEDIKKLGLKIIDSEKTIFIKKINETPELKNTILGCVSVASKNQMLKYTKTVLTFSDSSLTPTSQQWAFLAVAGSRTCSLNRGTIANDDIRKGVVIEVENDPDLLMELHSLQIDDLYRERVAHRAWQQVNLKHTFNHRIKQICEVLSIPLLNNTNKKASLITPTYRVDQLQHVIDTFQMQTYKNKELLVVYNGAEAIPSDTLDKFKKKQNITLLTLPPEKSVAECLNLGNSVANGDFCFRLDDDDYYAKNYISDMMLGLNAVDMKIFGRVFSYFITEEDQQLNQYSKKGKTFCIASSEDLLTKRLHLAGNTIGGERTFMLSHRYPEKSYNTADIGFVLNAALEAEEACSFDSFNVVVSRREDLSTHTWRVPKDQIGKNVFCLVDSSKDDVFV